MNSAITRTSLILATLTLVFLMPVTCHAQSEVSPDSYPIDNTTSAANTTNSQMALASQPASVTLSQPQVSTASFLQLNNSARLDHSAGLGAVRRVRAASACYVHRFSDFLTRYTEGTSLMEQLS